MDINRIYEELDALKYPEIEGYLRDKISEAKEKDVFDVYIPLLNELIGFFRDSTQFDKGNEVKRELIDALNSYGQNGTMNYATSMLNIANFDRAAGAHEDSLVEFKTCEEVYHKLLPKGDYLWAGLYNNKSLLYQEMGDNLAAIGALEDALYVVKEIPGREAEVATTYVNIAQSFISLGQVEEAKNNIAEALKIFEKEGNTDYHYSGACAVCGAIAYAEGDYDKAADWYDKGAEIVHRIMGDNGNYRILKMSADEARTHVIAREEVKDAVGEAKLKDDGSADDKDLYKDISGLDLSKAFYEEFGAPMIHKSFPEYESRIAVGLFGEGSDCMRLDDEVSRDHDWGPGFMMLMRRDVYDEIGDRLKAEYDALPGEYRGYKRNTTAEGEGRVGAICIEDLLCKYLPELFGDNNRNDMASALSWVTDKEITDAISRNRLMLVPETVLAQFINGEIWRDDIGVISTIRNKVAEYYDDATWIKRLAVSLIKTAQAGQYNLPRTLSRGDRTTAFMYVSDYIKNVLHTLFLINRTYAPYDKWLVSGAGRLGIHPEIADIMKALSDIYVEDMASGEACADADKDAYVRITGTIEITSQIILQALKETGVVSEDEDNWYLEVIGKKILNGEYKRMDKEQMIEQIVKLEWEAFDKVDNEGGRAFCQDDWATFSIMRKSQYMEWNEPMLASFTDDFNTANARGWNLITEKYARMEKTTSPEEYEKIKDKLPPHTEQQDAIIEQIVAIQVGMMEDVAGKYPKLADNARTLHTADDKPWDTSYETYLRGELGTYSERTLALYGMFIAEIAKAGGNLAYNIISNTAKLYGYDSIEDAEAKL